LQHCITAAQDKDDIRVLAWPNMQAAQEICDCPDATTPDEILSNEAVLGFVREHLEAHNKGVTSSRRVKRLMLMLEPPSIDGHEITDKGYINQRATLERRAKLADLLYEADLPTRTVEV
jgi:feruloyl-CoA synthase